MRTQVIFRVANYEESSLLTENVLRNFHEANLKINTSVGNVWRITVNNCHPEQFICSSPYGILAPDGEWLCETEPQGLQYFASTIELRDTTGV